MRPVGMFDMVEHFTDVARDLGLTIKNDWMQVECNEGEWVQGQEHFGYEKFLKYGVSLRNRRDCWYFLTPRCAEY